MKCGENKHERTKGGIFDIHIQVYDWIYNGTECMYRKQTTILGSYFYNPFKFFITWLRDILFYANYDLKYKLKQI